jgi:hypothetical protein
MQDKVADKPKAKMTGTDLAETINLWALAGEIGWRLAIPIVVLVLAGAKVDKELGSAPLGILVGIFISLATSVLLVGQMIRRINGTAK